MGDIVSLLVMTHLPAFPRHDHGLAIPAGYVPSLFLDGRERTWRRYVEFFTAQIRNRNTRTAYAHAAHRFSTWCERRKVTLDRVTPVVVAIYVEEMMAERSRPTVKLHLAAIRMLFDYLVTGHVLETNPAAPVRGPRYSVTRGKTPVLEPEQARHLLDSIDVTTIAGLRDRALLGAMIYSFARVSAVLAMNVEDYYTDGKRHWLRLHEKGGKFHEVPLHPSAKRYVDEYLGASGLAGSPKHPLFPSLDRQGFLSSRRLSRRDALAIVKRRARSAGLPDRICCHTCRASGITAFMLSGGSLERAQRIAAHSSPHTTKLYDRSSDEITMEEIERIRI
jgi:integrase/recombinase XerD